MRAQTPQDGLSAFGRFDSATRYDTWTITQESRLGLEIGQHLPHLLIFSSIWVGPYDEGFILNTVTCMKLSTGYKVLSTTAEL